MLKLELGCGKNKKEGFFGIDCNSFPGVDAVVNIDKENLPFAENTVDEIYSHHTLEHCSNLIHVMNEIWRVCKPDATIYLITPYGTSHQFVQDPTHKTPINEDTWRKYFCNPDYIASFSDYGLKGFFEEVEIFIKGKDILHLELHAKLKVKK